METGATPVLRCRRAFVRVSLCKATAEPAAIANVRPEPPPCAVHHPAPRSNGTHSPLSNSSAPMSLIDSPQANNLGLHPAILFNGREARLETFRPYALPDEGWLAEIGAELAK